MIKNYLTTAWRALTKNKLFSFINIFGLALSMSVCMMVLVRIVDNFSYDNFHPQASNVYRINSTVIMNEGNKVDLATTPLPLLSQLEPDTHLIRKSVSLYPAINGDATDGVKSLPVHGAFTQPAFMEVFGFHLKYGDAASVLSAPFTVVLSQRTAEKFFGDTDPLGKTIELGELGMFQVTGVMETPPSKSHISFDVLASASTIVALEQSKKLPSLLEEWDTFEKTYTYVLTYPDVRHESIEQVLNDIAIKLNQQSQGAQISFNAQPLNRITPGWTQRYHETSRGTSWSKLFAEVGIALVILVAACFNYTNLSIARALTRGKEVGIRKLSGAVRWQIFAQYIVEAVIIALFALSLAHLLLAFILEFKPFNDGYEMIPDVGISVEVFLLFLLFAIVAGVMAGAMPAWILSSFKPARVLRNIGTEKIIGGLPMRKALMIFQFSLSLVVIIFLTAFYKQFTFIGTTDPGFSQQNLLVVPFSGSADVIKSRFSQISGVEKIGFTSAYFGKRNNQSIALHQLGSQNHHQFGQYSVDAELINAMHLTIVAGENFKNSFQQRSDILITEKAARLLGYPIPADAIGTKYILNDSTHALVRGVIKDFHNRHVGDDFEPLVFSYNPNGFREMLIEVDPSSKAEIRERLATAWKQVYNDHAFTPAWFDLEVREQNSQTASISLLGFLAFMTVTIATLGLLGLVVYTVETRRKEISIRKIVGASVAQIMFLLSSGYTKLLLIAGAIGIPAGYFLSQFFLMAFANRVPFGFQSLALSFLILLVIGLATILSQTFRASSENPSQNLRSE